MNKTFIEEQQKIAREKGWTEHRAIGFVKLFTTDELDTLISQTILATEADTLARVREETAEIFEMRICPADRECPMCLRGLRKKCDTAEYIALSEISNHIDSLTPTPLESDKTEDIGIKLNV